MAIDDGLEGLDPVDAMAAEAARIEAHYAALTPDRWQAASRCAGWSVRDVLAHLTSSEDYHRACLEGRVAALIQGMVDRGALDLDGADAMGIADLAEVGDTQLLDRWVQTNAVTREGFRERGSGEVDTTVGMYPARWQAFHVAGELAVHADDIGVAVPAVERADRQDWRVRVPVFVVREQKPEVEIEHRDGRTNVRGQGVDAELDDHDFVEAVAGRADPDRVAPDVRALLTTMPE